MAYLILHFRYLASAIAEFWIGFSSLIDSYMAFPFSLEVDGSNGWSLPCCWRITHRFSRPGMLAQHFGWKLLKCLFSVVSSLWYIKFNIYATGCSGNASKHSSSRHSVAFTR